MLRGLRDRLSYANVVATLALFAALGGGTALAIHAPNTVDSRDVINDSLRAIDIEDAPSGSDAINADLLDGRNATDLGRTVSFYRESSSNPGPTAVANYRGIEISAECAYIGGANFLRLAAKDATPAGRELLAILTYAEDDGGTAADTLFQQSVPITSSSTQLASISGSSESAGGQVVFGDEQRTATLDFGMSVTSVPGAVRCQLDGLLGGGP